MGNQLFRSGSVCGRVEFNNTSEVLMELAICSHLDTGDILSQTGKSIPVPPKQSITIAWDELDLCGKIDGKCLAIHVKPLGEVRNVEEKVIKVPSSKKNGKNKFKLAYEGEDGIVVYEKVY